MSMPSSSEEVATTAGSRPAFSSSSTSARCSRDTEPWCARATTTGAPSPVPACADTAAGIPPGCRARRPAAGGARRRLPRPAAGACRSRPSRASYAEVLRRLPYRRS